MNNIILQHLILKINHHLENNLTLIHYITNNSNDYYILLKTSDKNYVGKIIEIDNVSTFYENRFIPFKFTNEVLFYCTEELIEFLLQHLKENQLLFDSYISDLIKKNYSKEWIHNFCNLNNNFNTLNDII